MTDASMAFVAAPPEAVVRRLIEEANLPTADLTRETLETFMVTRLVHSPPS